jgi:hypothetical protein
MKKVKMNLGVLALIAALAITVTGSAFKSTTVNGTYGKVEGTGPWVDISISPGEDLEYYCDFVEELCHAEFTANPETDPNAQMIPDTEVSGILKIREIED